MSGPRIAFVTCAEIGDVHEDDAPLAAALEARGATVAPATWSDPAVDWSRFDLLLLRSTWDYHEDVGAFRAWVARAGRAAPLFNPPGVVDWNVDKRYLRRLAAAGVPTVPTRWLPAGAAVDLAALLAAEGWTEAVVKPAVGLGASGLRRVGADEAGRRGPGSPQAHLDGLLAAGDVMVQPFVPSLERDGELSLVHAGRALSHALRKRPPAGEFRVQPHFGAVATPATPTDAERAVAERALAAVAGPLLYARVDLVAAPDGTPSLMELELVEPTLYLDVDPAAADRFARVVLDAAAAPSAASPPRGGDGRPAG